MRRGRLVVDDDVDSLRSSEKVVEAVFETSVPDLNGLASDVRVRRIERSGRMLRAYVHADSAEIAKRVETLGPKSVNVLDLGLGEIFLNAVEADRTLELGETS